MDVQVHRNHQWLNKNQRDMTVAGVSGSQYLVSTQNLSSSFIDLLRNDSVVLGLGATQLVLFGLTVVVGALTVVPGRATRLQGAVHLAIMAAFQITGEM